MGSKSFQDIYFEYSAIFRASWLLFGKDTAQSFQSHLESFIFVKVSVVFVNAEKFSVQNSVTKIFYFLNCQLL